MSDLEKLEKVFTELKIGFERKKYEENIVILLEKGNEKVTGYGGFFTEFSFDLDGKFIEVGCWE